MIRRHCTPKSPFTSPSNGYWYVFGQSGFNTESLVTCPYRMTTTGRRMDIAVYIRALHMVVRDQFSVHTLANDPRRFGDYNGDGRADVRSIGGRGCGSIRTS